MDNLTNVSTWPLLNYKDINILSFTSLKSCTIIINVGYIHYVLWCFDDVTGYHTLQCHTDTYFIITTDQWYILIIISHLTQVKKWQYLTVQVSMILSVSYKVKNINILIVLMLGRHVAVEWGLWSSSRVMGRGVSVGTHQLWLQVDIIYTPHFITYHCIIITIETVLVTVLQVIRWYQVSYEI